LRGYEIWINQWLTDRSGGSPDALVQRRIENDEPVVEVDVAPQYVRFVKLRSLSESPFEIDELEVYGTGYLDQAVYYSDIIDLGDNATIGPLNWVENIVGDERFSSLSLRLRSGNDATSILYRKRVIVTELQLETQVEVTAEEYAALESTEKLFLEHDTQNWSPWTSVRNNTQSTAPGPRRYIQFELRFTGRLFDARQLDRLRFNYLSPSLADTLRAEVFPRLADAEKPATFRYAVLLRGNGQQRGYDRLEVDTNVPVETIRNLRLNGEPYDFTIESITPAGFQLTFPLITTDTAVLTFTFDLPVFRFGTTFSGRAFNSRFPTVPQRLIPGQVTGFGPTDFDELSNLAVAIPKPQIGKLIGEIALTSRLFTPNDDGANDHFEMFFNILQLLEPAQ
jgi:hypothetical protein